MPALCQHTLLEYYGCDSAQLKHARAVKKILCAAILKGGGTIVKTVFHNFSPYGVSGVVVITESHVTIHTWPEHGYAAVDIFSCSKKLDHSAIKNRIKKELSARRISSRSFKRGSFLPKKIVLSNHKAPPIG
jgi:S-adenosylmethionine decarboxylase